MEIFLLLYYNNKFFIVFSGYKKIIERTERTERSDDYPISNGNEQSG